MGSLSRSGKHLLSSMFHYPGSIITAVLLLPQGLWHRVWDTVLGKVTVWGITNSLTSLPRRMVLSRVPLTEAA